MSLMKMNISIMSGFLHVSFTKTVKVNHYKIDDSYCGRVVLRITQTMVSVVFISSFILGVLVHYTPYGKIGF